MKKMILIVIVNIVMLCSVVAVPLPKSTSIGTPPMFSNIQTLHGTSPNWAGYAVETNLNSPQSYAITDVKGSWIVPAVVSSGMTNAYSASWIGIDGYSSNTVEQIGTDSNVNNGVAVYAAWYEMFPKAPVYLTMTINPGDTISAEVNYIGMGRFRLSITDVTTGESFSTIQKSSDATIEVSSDPVISSSTEQVLIGTSRPLTNIEPTTKTASYDMYHTISYTTIPRVTVPTYEGALLFGPPHRSSAEWIIEAPSDFNGQVLPLADFGTAFFFDSQVTVNGVTGSINNAHWQNDAITMQTLASPPMIKAQPSVLSTDGTSFSITWEHQ